MTIRNVIRAASIVLALTLALVATPAYAHGFGEGVNLPVPVEQYYGGAAAAVILSFVLVGLFAGRRETGDNPGYPRYNLLKSSLRDVLVSSPIRIFLKACLIALLLITIAAGLGGEGLLPATMVWVFFAVGVAYVSAFVGNIWMSVSPWKSLFDWFERTFPDALPEPRPWPVGFGVWPALSLFLFYRWTEDAFPDRATPDFLAFLIIGYSIVTFAGMAYFGLHTWLRFGDPFAVFFRLLAKFSPTEVRVTVADCCEQCASECEYGREGCVDCYDCFEEAREEDREINLRPPAAGLTLTGQAGPGEIPFVLLMLSSLAFDGFKFTGAWKSVEAWLGPATIGEFALTNTLGLFLLFGAFLVAYLAFTFVIRLLAGSRQPVAELALRFVYSLLPIAVAYEVAHYVMLLLVDGQNIIRLTSDPFARDWDLLGTADFPTNFSPIPTQLLWNGQVLLIVIGHVIGVYLAHLTAVKVFADRPRALRSQIPMVCLMVGYTVFSLWLLSASIQTPG